MSTSNYTTMHDFPLYVWDLTEEYFKEFCLNNSYRDWEDTEEDKQLVYNTTIEDMYDLFNLDLDVVLNTVFKRDLLFFNISLEPGYYSGVQLYVTPVNSLKYYNSSNISELDNEDTHYLFNMCRSEFLIKYNSEINYINKKVLPYFASNYNMFKINCVGIYSNGEAIYEIA